MILNKPTGLRHVLHGRTPDPQTAVLFVAGVAVIFFGLGITLQIHFGELGLLAAEWLLLFVPAVLFVRFGRFDARVTLSLRRPGVAGLVAALLLAVGATPVAWGIGWIQTFFLPIPWDILEGLEKLVTAGSPARLVWLLLLLAATPAVCEEIVFRGVLLGGSRGLAPWRMVLLNGVVFGTFHLSFETVIRFLPTAWLGIVISWAVLRTGSIWVGVLIHLLNNGTIVVLASIPALRALVSDPTAPPPMWLMPMAVASLYAGVRILASLPAAVEVAEPLTSSEDP